MPTLGMGIKGGVSVVKIMKDNADDPLTTPNSDTGKFAFNSEQPGNAVGFILDIVVVDVDFLTYPSSGGTPTSQNQYFLPPGSNRRTCEVMIASWDFSGNSFQNWFFFPSYFQNKYGISYVPLVEVRSTLDYVNKNKFNGPRLDSQSGSTTGIGQIYSFGAEIPNISAGNWLLVTNSGPSGSTNCRAAIGTQMNSSGSPAPVSRFLMSVFALPAYSDAVPDYSAVAVSGQEVVRIDKGSGGMARVALPGYDVYEGNLNRFLLHENRIPAKVLAAGELAVASGATEIITTRFQLPITTYMDYIVRRAGSLSSEEFQFWRPPFVNSTSMSDEVGFTYTVSGNTISVTSTADMDIVIRYMVCANAGSSQSSGGKKILLKDNDGFGDYIQIKKPGSSDVAPNLDDIMIDTRVTYIPILAEGFLNYNATDMPIALVGTGRQKGERGRSLTIPNPNGLLLFPKMGSVYVPWTASGGNFVPFSMWGAHGIAIGPVVDAGHTTGYSTWANIVDETHVNLYSGGNNAYTYQQSGNVFFPNNLLGVRYYILGIPPSL